MKRKAAVAVAGLSAVAILGGTLAYFNSTMTADNKLNTTGYGTTLEETFNPMDGVDVKPGVEVEKKVGVKNTGNQDVVVRVKFEEKWTRTDAEGKTINVKENNASVTTSNTDQKSAVDGEVTEDGTVVSKNMVTTGWTKANDGWYYLNAKLGKGQSVEDLLKSVTFISDMDLGKRTVTYTYTGTKGSEAIQGTVPAEFIGEDEKIDLKRFAESLGLAKGDILNTNTEIGVDPTAQGYSNADYSLVVTAQTCQATDKAVADFFSKDEDGAVVTIPADILAGWNLQKEDLN